MKLIRLLIGVLCLMMVSLVSAMRQMQMPHVEKGFIIQLVPSEQFYLVPQELLNTSEFVNYFIKRSYVSKCDSITVLNASLAITTEQFHLWELWFASMQQKGISEGTEILLRQLSQEKRDVLKDLTTRLKIIPALERCLEFCIASLKDAHVYPPPRSPSIWGKPPTSVGNKPSTTKSSLPSLKWMPMESPESVREKMDRMSPPSSSSSSNLESPYSFDWEDPELPDLFALNDFTLD